MLCPHGSLLKEHVKILSQLLGMHMCVRTHTHTHIHTHTHTHTHTHAHTHMHACTHTCSLYSLLSFLSSPYTSSRPRTADYYIAPTQKQTATTKLEELHHRYVEVMESNTELEEKVSLSQSCIPILLQSDVLKPGQLWHLVHLHLIVLGQSNNFYHYISCK